MTPTERSMKLLRERGYLVSRCEHYNFYAKKRFDLFGVFDIVAVHPLTFPPGALAFGITGIQSTTASNLSSRRQKIARSEAAKAWKANLGNIYLHGWRKKQGRWVCKEEQL